MPSYSGLLHPLDFMLVYFKPPPRSLLNLCCILRFGYAHGVPGCVSVMTPPKYLYLLIGVSTVFATKTPPPKARPRTSTYREEIHIWK